MGTLWALQSSQPGLSFYSPLPQAYGTSSYAISLGCNIVMTALIMTRLLIYRRTIMRSLGRSTEHARGYTSLATIVVESASLYSVFAILFAITYALDNPMNQIFFSLANSAQVGQSVFDLFRPFESKYVSFAVQQIANYLIIHRVAQGRGWRNTTATKRMSINSAAGPQRVYGLLD